MLISSVGLSPVFTTSGGVSINPDGFRNLYNGPLEYWTMGYNFAGAATILVTQPGISNCIDPTAWYQQTVDVDKGDSALASCSYEICEDRPRPLQWGMYFIPQGQVNDSNYHEVITRTANWNLVSGPAFLSTNDLKGWLFTDGSPYDSPSWENTNQVVEFTYPGDANWNAAAPQTINIIINLIDFPSN